MPESVYARIEFELESYKFFYDLEWAKQITSLSQGTEFYGEVMKLQATWKGAANAARMPWLVNLFANNLVTAYQEEHIRSMVSMPAAIYSKMAKSAVPPLTENQSISLRNSATQIAYEFSTITPPALNADGLFMDLARESDELKLAIIGTQRMCYTDLFFGYEKFLLQLVRSQLNKPELQTKRHKEFGQHLDEAFGPDAGNYLWNSICGTAKI